MITQQQVIEQELASKTIEILQLKIQLAHFSNENEELKKQLQIAKATNQTTNINDKLRKNLVKNETQ